MASPHLHALICLVMEARMPEFAAVVANDVRRLTQTGMRCPVPSSQIPQHSSYQQSLRAASTMFCDELILPTPIPPEGLMFDFANDDEIIVNGHVFSRIHFARNLQLIGQSVFDHYQSNFGQTVTSILAEECKVLVLEADDTASANTTAPGNSTGDVSLTASFPQEHSAEVDVGGGAVEPSE